MDLGELVLSNEELAVIDDGAWVSDIEGAVGLRLKVRGLRSEAARKAIEKEKTQLRVGNKGKPLSDRQLADAMNKVMAEHILLDWQGLTDKGKPVAYDKALARQWLSSRNGERFSGIVLQASTQVDSDPASFVEIASKN